MGNTTEGKQKRLYLEAMRILAVFFVIFNHTDERGFFLFAHRSGVSFWGYLGVSVFCCFAVPLFFAISGALMLSREEESLAVLWRKRIGKYVAILCVLFLCNFLAEAVVSGEPVDWRNLLASVYAGWFSGGYALAGHLWYLYAYIAYLICLPFLRTLVQNLKTRYFYYWIGIALFFSALLPAAEYLVSRGEITLCEDLNPGWLAEGIVLYPAVGYFLEYRASFEKKKRNLLWLWLLNGLGIAAACFMVYYEGRINGYYKTTFHPLFALLNCIAVYVTVKYLFTHFPIPPWLEKGVLSLGKCTFGIYLIHVVVLDSAPMGWLFAFLTGHGVNSMLACLMQCAAVMAVCYGITCILRRIPVVKKLVGG